LHEHEVGEDRAEPERAAENVNEPQDNDVHRRLLRITTTVARIASGLALHRQVCVTTPSPNQGVNRRPG
jgi:hypothetical protein